MFKRKYGWLLIALSAFLWGFDGVFLTPRYFTNGFYNVKFIVFISHLVPLIILSLVFTKEYKKLFEFSMEDYLYYGLIALFGGCIGTLSIVKALQLSNFSLSLVTVIQQSQPVFAVILALIILKERPSKNFYPVFIIALISLYFLVFGFNSPKLLEKNNLLAAFYSLIAAISFGSATVFGKKVMYKHSFITTVFYRFLFTTIIISLILVFSNDTVQSFNQYISSPNLYKLTLIIATLSLTSLSMYYIGMKTTTAILATMSELMYPLGSILIEAVYYKRTLTITQFIFSIILIISIVYLNINNIKEKDAD